MGLKFYLNNDSGDLYWPLQLCYIGVTHLHPITFDLLQWDNITKATCFLSLKAFSTSSLFGQFEAVQNDILIVDCLFTILCKLHLGFYLNGHNQSYNYTHGTIISFILKLLTKSLNVYRYSSTLQNSWKYFKLLNLKKILFFDCLCYE